MAINKIKRFIKWVIDETKGVYYDIRDWNVTDEDLDFVFWVMCVLWAAGLLYFFITFEVTGPVFDI